MDKIHEGDIVVMVELQDGMQTDRPGVVVSQDFYGPMPEDRYYFVDFGPDRPVSIARGIPFGHTNSGMIVTETGWSIRGDRLRLDHPKKPPEPLITTPWWET